MLETYGIDVWAAPWDDLADGERTRLAALAFQLRPSSRTRTAIDPAGSHGIDVLLMRRVEHELRTWLWAHTPEAKSQDAPEPFWLPGEDERHERIVEATMRDARQIASAFGLAQE